jgi:hypothetical protein
VPGLSRVFYFAFTAALNPTLLTATTVILLSPSPKRLMLGYLAGAYTTGIIAGVALVESLSNSTAVSTTKRSISPSIDIALGTIALIAAYVIWRGDVAKMKKRRTEKRGGTPKDPPS